MELIEVISAKLHGIKITESALHYHGSVTIDEDILRKAGIRPMEFVYIWNKASGARISTYVLPGEKGSGVVCLNGAAARSCQVGDEVIISLSKYVTNDEMAGRKAKVLTFNHESRINTIDEILEYDFISDTEDNWQFKINKLY